MFYHLHQKISVSISTQIPCRLFQKFFSPSHWNDLPALPFSIIIIHNSHFQDVSGRRYIWLYVDILDVSGLNLHL